MDVARQQTAEPDTKRHANPSRPWTLRIGKKARRSINRLVARYSLVPVEPVLDPAAFPWLKELEEAAPQIQAEADRLLRHLDGVPPINVMSPDHQRIAGDGGWRSFFMMGYGYKIEGNWSRCPDTARALEKVPGLVTALFSILQPGMHIARHKGVTKGILVTHLGLRVPKEGDRCRMEVGGVDVRWREGGTVVFDDTFPHEVWNDTDEHRVILLVQFKRPMRLIGRIVSNLFIWGVRHSPYIQDARRNVGYWEQRLAQSEASLSD